jgi:hypothetical protein
MHEVAGFGEDGELVFACDDDCQSGEFGIGVRDYDDGTASRAVLRGRGSLWGGYFGERRRERDEPCIWPIINSLSSLSVPASRRSLPPRDSRNFLESPTNQFSQKGVVAERSVRQVHWDGDDVVVVEEEEEEEKEEEEGLSSISRDGTEMRAE